MKGGLNMVEFKRERKTYAENDSIRVKTVEGDFEVSLEENGCLYIGFCVPEENKLPNNKIFTITKENECLYALTENLYESFKSVDLSGKSEPVLRMIKRDNPYHEGKVIWYSDDFKIQDASILTIEKDDNGLNIYIYFYKK